MVERVFHHYEELEEFHAGMWKITTGAARKAHMQAAADLMRDWPKFEMAMQRAVSEWPKSCAHNLTVEAANRIAWLGHAGCCIGAGSPEEATRAAWHMLNAREQNLANMAASIVLRQWLDKHEIEGFLF